MNRKEIGDYLILFFRKRSASFLANIYKVGITSDSRDIHRARLDVKKIFALYGLFEMVSPDHFGGLRGYRIFRPLYRQAGKIREMQVSQLLIATPEFSPFSTPALVEWLRRKEAEAAEKFIRQVKDFREKDLKAMEKEVEQVCRKGTLFRLRSKTYKYALARVEMIRETLASHPDEQGLHHIRKHLKEVSTLVTLVQTVKPNTEQEKLITALNRTEMMIGDWHDRIVLTSAVERYLDEEGPDAAEVESMHSFIRSLGKSAENLVHHFIPEVEAVTMLIRNDAEDEDESQ